MTKFFISSRSQLLWTVVAVLSSSFLPRSIHSSQHPLHSHQKNIVLVPRPSGTVFGLRRTHGACDASSALVLLRGGADDSEDEYEYEDESDDDDEQTDSDEEEEEEATTDDDDEEESDGDEAADDDDDVVVYDEVLMPNSMSSMGVTLGVMAITKKLDLTDTKIIRYARAAFLAYVIICQIFYAYVRVQARLTDDRTPITVTNPLTNLVKNQLNNSLKDDESSSPSSNTSMAKSLADRFLSSQSTVMEYDISQSKKMGSGMLFSLAFMWFLHFKMNQVQPLFFQTASGLLTFAYSPLVQVYILGRNLERPFQMVQNPFMPPTADVPLEDAVSSEEAVEGETNNGDVDDSNKTTPVQEESEEEDVEKEDTSDDDEEDDDDSEVDSDDEYDEEESDED